MKHLLLLAGALFLLPFLSCSGLREREDVFAEAEDEEMEPSALARHRLSGPPTAQHFVDELFAGRARAKAKTTMLPGSAISYSNLLALLNDLPKDAQMLSHSPSINMNSDRVSEEDKNVRVDAWIFAIHHEADNDIHVILGDKQGRFMTAEVSGGPRSGGQAQQFKAVRSDFAQIVGIDAINQCYKGYKQFSTPIHVEIEGSLFFDIDHKAGAIGPAGMHPKTAWEIHPVQAVRNLN